MTTILIADDHDVVRRGLRAILEARAPWRVVAEACDGKGAVASAFRFKPDVAIIDYGLPRLNGIEATRQIRHHLPGTEILIFTMHNTDDILLHALEAGAQLVLIEGFAAAVLLDHPGHHQFRHLVGGEALGAAEALPATAHLIALRDQARVDNLGVLCGAKGAVHGLISLT